MTDGQIDTALFCAFRYALGRCTYVVDDIAGLLIEYRDSLSVATKQQIKTEIEEAIDSNNAGMSCDIDSWLKVRRSL